MNNESVGSKRGAQCVEKDHLLLVNGGEKSGALYVSVTRDGLILLCLYIQSPLSDMLYKITITSTVILHCRGLYYTSATLTFFPPLHVCVCVHTHARLSG